MIIRMTVPVYDFEDRRKEIDNIPLALFIIFQI